MKSLLKGLIHRFDRDVIEREIEEELRFHLELLTEQQLARDLPLAEAKVAALRRFGDVEEIKDQCVEISRRNRPLERALKSLLILVFLGGVLVRVFGTEVAVARAGDVLIAIAFLGRVFFYVRGLSPSHFTSNDGPTLILSERRKSFIAYDQTSRTPLERVISDS